MSVQSENRCESIHKACGVYCNIIIQRMLNETSLSFRDANSGWHLCCYCFKMSRLLSLFLTVLVVMSIGITPIVRGVRVLFRVPAVPLSCSSHFFNLFGAL